MHRTCEQGNKDPGKVDYFGIVGTISCQLLHIPKEMGIAVLDLARRLVVSAVPVYHKEAGKIFYTEDALRDQ